MESERIYWEVVYQQGEVRVTFRPKIPEGEIVPDFDLKQLEEISGAVGQLQKKYEDKCVQTNGFWQQNRYYSLCAGPGILRCGRIGAAYAFVKAGACKATY